MNKIISFLSKSNRYKHLIGGFLVAALAGNSWAAIYATLVAASCLELKDRLYGNSWDWVDWACTLAGAIPPCIVYLLMLLPARAMGA